MSVCRIKVELDDSVFRRLGFNKAMDCKWNIESDLADLASQSAWYRFLLREFDDEIQKKKIQNEKISS